MKLCSLTLSIACILLSPISSGQTSNNAQQRALIMSVIYDWADTLTTNDLERRKQVTIDGSMIQRMRQQPDGSFSLTPSIVSFAEMQPSNSVMVERFWDEELVVIGPFATFIAAYDFWIDGEFSHCGSDVFDLVNVEGKWKIGNMKFTIIRDGCPPSPLGALGTQ